MEKTRNFSEEKILPALIGFALPVLFALFLQTMYGAVFIVAYNLPGSIFRGIGDSGMPLLTVAIACVLNIGGDMLLPLHKPHPGDEMAKAAVEAVVKFPVEHGHI